MSIGSEQSREWTLRTIKISMACGALVLSGACSTAPPTTGLASLTQATNPGLSLACYKGDRRGVRPGLSKVCLMERGQMKCLSPC